MKKIITTVLVGMMLGCFSASAFAGEQAEEGNWDFNLAPSLSLDGGYGR